MLKNQPKTEQITLKSYIKDIYDPEKSQKYGVINSQETLKSLFRRLLSFPGEKFQANLTEHWTRAPREETYLCVWKKKKKESISFAKQHQNPNVVMTRLD